ncbi:MAG: N-acetylmuramoyl-L-alanine amidase [Candidatus Limnocylindrales bacterium]
MRNARRRSLPATFAASLLVAAVTVAGLPILRAVISSGGVDVASGSVDVSVDNQRLVRLPIAASHVVLHWRGVPDAQISLALGRSPNALGEEIPSGLADGSGEDGDMNYSEVIWADGARWARVTTDRPIEHLTVVAMDTDESRGIDESGVVSAAVNKPAVITRASWGANESYSENSGGYMRFAPSFSPVQKLIVHHTAGANNDPNPTATIRAIFYDHAVLRGYGDIDYNFIVDAQGRVYEGRRAWVHTPLTSPTGEDLAGNVVRGSHAKHYNDATVGIVLLGTFTNVMPTTAARNALVTLLAWKAERHGMDPKGASTYVNPIDGTTKYLYNISGHRNVNTTACPGEVFYNTFPTLRQDVANKIAATTGAAVDSTPPSAALKSMATDPSGAHTLPFGLIFSEPITGLTADDFTVTGTSPGWTVQSVTGNASTYTVKVIADESGEGPADGTVVLTLAADAVTDKATRTGPTADAVATVNFATETEPPVAVLYATATRSEPIGTSFGISVEFNEPVTGFDIGDISIGGTSHAANPWMVELVYGSNANYNFTVSNLTAANGTLTVQIAEGALQDMAGNPGGGSNVITKTIDRSAPTTSTPTVALRANTRLSSTTQKVNVSWTGSDVGPSGIKNYDVARSYDGKAFEIIGSAVTGTTFGWSMTPGHTYRFEVRARDNAGNVSAWKVSPTLTPALTQQSSSAVTYSGSSTTTSYASYSGGTQRYLGAAGASASYTTTARSLSFVTTKSPTRGTAKIYIDGVLAATVNLNGTTTFRYVAFSKTWSSVGTHRITVVSVGTPVARVDIDAFGVIR